MRKVYLASYCLFAAISCATYSRVEQQQIDASGPRRNPTMSQAISLLLVKVDKDDLSFKIVNGSARSIFLAYDVEARKLGNPIFVPSVISCRTDSGGRAVDFSPRFDLAPEINELSSNQELLFRVKKPAIIGSCTISLQYFDEIVAVKLLNDKNPYLSEDEKKFVTSRRKLLKTEFEIE